jgi:hypothetical protein
VIDRDDMPSLSDLAPPPPPERLELVVCECGQVSRVQPPALAPCGRARALCMGPGCELVHAVYELVPEGETCDS